MNALDDMVGRLKDTDRCLYERAMIELYELRNGCHYDERHAIQDVSKMYHSERDGKICDGEHWDYLQTTEAVKPFINMMSDTDTMWDAYVAINMWWHDIGRNYSRRNQPDEQLIEDAMVWSFGDEDAPDGKVWRYIRAMSV